MAVSTKEFGLHMRAEMAQSGEVFAKSVMQEVVLDEDMLGDKGAKAIYTVARGSSDAAALILAYQFMAQLRIPVTSLPPSVFSIGNGVSLADAMTLVISQSGASDDLVRSAQGARASGAKVVALTNVPGSPVEASSDVSVHVGAGPELAVPATKTVIGSIAAGMALLAAMDPKFLPACKDAAAAFAAMDARTAHPAMGTVSAALLRAQHVYVIGRGAGFGAAQEVALKLKETCALHAEAYSASEVLHGPLQLASKSLTIVMLDTMEATTSDSMDEAERRFRAAGAEIYRLRPTDLGCAPLCPAASAAALLYAVYPIILSVALALGFDPDAPSSLAKVTRTA